jgi:hypothetical protein
MKDGNVLMRRATRPNDHGGQVRRMPLENVSKGMYIRNYED